MPTHLGKPPRRETTSIGVIAARAVLFSISSNISHTPPGIGT
jgi:hypothetical protein